MKCCDMKIPQRKPTRLDGFDYSAPGAYFVTICTKDKKCILGEIVGDDAHIVPQNKLSQIGLVCEKYILNINTVYEIVRVDNYVIMPNHIHLLLSIHGTMWASSPTINVETIIRSFKTLVTKETGGKIFQRSFHDHIIRGEEDYIKIAEYIDTNPLKWELDCFYEKTRQ